MGSEYIPFGEKIFKETKPEMQYIGPEPKSNKKSSEQSKPITISVRRRLRNNRGRIGTQTTSPSIMNTQSQPQAQPQSNRTILGG